MIGKPQLPTPKLRMRNFVHSWAPFCPFRSVKAHNRTAESRKLRHYLLRFLKHQLPKTILLIPILDIVKLPIRLLAARRSLATATLLPQDRSKSTSTGTKDVQLQNQTHPFHHKQKDRKRIHTRWETEVQRMRLLVLVSRALSTVHLLTLMILSKLKQHRWETHLT